MRVGVLALQGGFAAHAAALAALGHEVELLREPAQLDAIEGLVLPGGESTTMWRLLDSSGLMGPLSAWRRGPVLATCAGRSLIAARVFEPAQDSLGWLDVDLRRNGYGRQVDSFESRADTQGWPLVFIRAPRIVRVGPDVEVLARHRERAGASFGGGASTRRPSTPSSPTTAGCMLWCSARSTASRTRAMVKQEHVLPPLPSTAPPRLRLLPHGR